MSSRSIRTDQRLGDSKFLEPLFLGFVMVDIATLSTFIIFLRSFKSYNICFVLRFVHLTDGLKS